MHDHEPSDLGLNLATCPHVTTYSHGAFEYLGLMPFEVMVPVSTLAGCLFWVTVPRLCEDAGHEGGASC